MRDCARTSLEPTKKEKKEKGGGNTATSSAVQQMAIVPQLVALDQDQGQESYGAVLAACARHVVLHHRARR